MKEVLWRGFKNQIYHRLDFLLGKLQAAYNDKDRQNIKAIKNIYSSELYRYLLKCLTPIVKGEKPSLLNRVTVTNADDETSTDITNSHEMNKAIINFNIRHFNQAAETPFAQPPLSSITPPFQSSSSIATKILQGNLTNFNDQDTIIQDILQNLKKLPFIQNLPLHMSDDDFKNGIRIILEGKTSPPSGRDYGMYKAMLVFPFTIQLIMRLIDTSVINNIILHKWKKYCKLCYVKFWGVLH